jgi:protoporphyrinogen IX oxidase
MLLLKALHIVFMVTWLAGLFYLPRLFVYHAMAGDQVSRDRFKVMERKLFWGIATPGGVLTVATGAALWLGWFQPTPLWLALKMALVALLLAYHAWCGKLMLDFRHERNARSPLWLRWFNEFPVLVLAGAVFLVVFKPL